MRGTDGPAMEKYWLCSERARIVKGAVPELVMCSVWVAVLPTTMLLKLKLVADSSRAGEAPEGVPDGGGLLGGGLPDGGGLLGGGLLGGGLLVPPTPETAMLVGEAMSALMIETLPVDVPTSWGLNQT